MPDPFLAAVTPSCLALRNRDDLFTCAEKCKLHSRDDNFHEQTAHKHGQRGELCRVGLQARQSVYSVLSALTSSSGPIVARQIPRNQHAIVRASYRNFKRANFVYLRSSLVPQKLARTLLLVSRTESYA